MVLVSSASVTSRSAASLSLAQRRHSTGRLLLHHCEKTRSYRKRNTIDAVNEWQRGPCQTSQLKGIILDKMAKKRNRIEAFFSRSRSVQDGTETKKFKHEAGAAATATATASQGEWMAADERRQLEVALALSMKEAQGQQDAVSKEVKEEQDDEKSSTDIKRERHDDDTSDTKDHGNGDYESVSVAKPEPDGASTSASSSSLAPLFAPSAAPCQAPTFTDDDFAPFGDAQAVQRLEGSLDCLYLPGWIKPSARKAMTRWLLEELAWHRVTYTRPGGMKIVTPRFTTTFGYDDSGAALSSYKIRPKKIPGPLLALKERLEELQRPQKQEDAEAGDGGGAGSPPPPIRYNCCILNFYADGKDSISYHSDDEAFLGPLPNIASLSLGGSRDFKLRRKAPAGTPVPAATCASGSKGSGPAATRPTETFNLTDGTLFVMKGSTQAEWEHAIPKRAKADPRINITFRRVANAKGTNNFQYYNRGGNTGEVKTFRFRKGHMVEAKGGI